MMRPQLRVEGRVVYRWFAKHAKRSEFGFGQDFSFWDAPSDELLIVNSIPQIYADLPRLEPGPYAFPDSSSSITFGARLAVYHDERDAIDWARYLLDAFDRLPDSEMLRRGNIEISVTRC